MPAMQLGQGYIFTGVCDSVHGGGVVHGCGGRVWLQEVRGCRKGMCGCGGHMWLQGVCMVVGGVWLWGACVVVGGVQGCRGACMVVGGEGACVVGGEYVVAENDEIRSMSGRYASYWNAFL